MSTLTPGPRSMSGVACHFPCVKLERKSEPPEEFLGSFLALEIRFRQSLFAFELAS